MTDDIEVSNLQMVRPCKVENMDEAHCAPFVSNDVPLPHLEIKVKLLMSSSLWVTIWLTFAKKANVFFLVFSLEDHHIASQRVPMHFENLVWLQRLRWWFPGDIWSFWVTLWLTSAKKTHIFWSFFLSKTFHQLASHRVPTHFENLVWL